MVSYTGSSSLHVAAPAASAATAAKFSKANRSELAFTAVHLHPVEQNLVQLQHPDLHSSALGRQSGTAACASVSLSRKRTVRLGWSPMEGVLLSLEREQDDDVVEHAESTATLCDCCACR